MTKNEIVNMIEEMHKKSHEDYIKNATILDQKIESYIEGYRDALLIVLDNIRILERNND